MNLTRRDVLRFTAGGAVGAMLTPVPWKALDDVAIWTQNWSWIPRPPRGAVTMRETACALCPAGCRVRARCIGGLPVSMHAADGAGLCALGLTAHHLPYHPARLTRPVRLFHQGVAARRVPVQLEAAVAAARDAMREAKKRSRNIAVLDMRPGRSVSWAWQRFLAGDARGIYIPAPTLLSRFPGGVDPASVKTIVSFRAALAEEWGSNELRKRLLDRSIRLIQVDPTRTATAAIAGRWIAARPGSEASLALAFAGSITPEAAAAVSGVPAAIIAAVAAELAGGKPAIAVAETGLGLPTENAIADLNATLGNGAVASAELPAPFPGETAAPTELADVADSSVALLLIDMSAGDAALPWPSIRQKLAPGATVIALSPFLAGTATNADYVVPTLPFLESTHEMPSRAESAAPRLALATAILPPHHKGCDVVEFIGAITGVATEWTTSEALMRARVARIHESGDGSIGDKPVKDFASADEMWEALAAGGPWTGAARQWSHRATRDVLLSAASTLGTPPSPLALVIRTPRDVTATAAVSPVMSKLYRESGLRRGPNVAAVNPSTARRLGLKNAQRASLILPAGKLTVTIATDSSVMPGVVEMAVAPDPVALGEAKSRASAGILDLVTADAGGSWRTVAARLEA